jgi:hypothetical protein
MLLREYEIVQSVYQVSSLVHPDQQIFMDLPETHLSAWWPCCVGWEQFVSAGVKSCSFSQRTQVLCVAF